MFRCVGTLFAISFPFVIFAATPLTVQVNAPSELHNATVKVTCADEVSKHTVDLDHGAGITKVNYGGATQCLLRASAEGYWSPEILVKPAIASEVALQVWPAGRIRAAVQADESVMEPTALRFRLVTASAGTGSERAQVLGGSCELEDGLIAGCALPAGLWHLRLEAEGLSPEYRWGIRIPRGDSLDLGAITLMEGGSILGQVLTVEGPADSRTTQIDLVPFSSIGMDDDELKLVAQSTALNQWGYFQFGGLGPGLYRVVAEQPGFAKTESPPVRITLDEERELSEPLILESLLRMQVDVVPLRPPGAGYWEIEVLDGRPGLSSRPTLSKGRTSTGSWTSAGLRLGPYIVVVGSPETGRVAEKPVRLDRDLQIARIDLDAVVVEGRAQLGDDDLEGVEIRFGDISVTTDQEGGFEVVLPREGQWRITVVSAEHAIVGRVVEEDINADSDGRAWLEIKLPDTVIHGQVIDGEGVPVPRGTISAMIFGNRESLVFASSNDDGWFEFHGMPPGEYVLTASTQKGGSRLQSQPYRTQVQEDEIPPPARLVLEDGWSLRGGVFDADTGEPVVNARVLAVPIAAGGLASVVPPQTDTGLDGSFDLSLPGSAAEAQLDVQAVGFTYHVQRVFRQDTEEDGHLAVGLSHESGALTLQVPNEGFCVLVINGHPVESMRVEEWARRNGVLAREEGHNLHIPAMPIGQYAYCRLATIQEMLLVIGGLAFPKENTCSTGSLSPAGELALGFPAVNAR